MADLKQHPGVKHRRFEITTAANTAIAAPQQTVLALANFVIQRVRVIVPIGHAGLTGIRVEYDGRPLLPWAEGAVHWLVADDYADTFDVDFPTGHALNVFTYNTDDTFAHTHYLGFDVVDVVDVIGADQSDDVPQVVIG